MERETFVLAIGQTIVSTFGNQHINSQETECEKDDLILCIIKIPSHNNTLTDKKVYYKGFK